MKNADRFYIIFEKMQQLARGGNLRNAETNTEERKIKKIQERFSKNKIKKS